MKTLIMYIVLFSFNAIFNNIFSQDINNCVHSYSALSPVTFKPSKTPAVGEYLRCLIIYVTLPDDNNPAPADNFWQPHSQPVSPNGSTGLLATSEGNPLIPYMDRYPAYTISDWFCEMSMGQLDLIGDEVYIELPETSEWYRDNGYHQAEMNRDAILQANIEYPNLDFAEYDRWRFNEGTQKWEPFGDGIVDMIIMSYRFIPSENDQSRWFFCGYAASGEASLGWCSGGSGWQNLVIDGKTIKGGFEGPREGSGCTNIGQLLRYSGVTEIIEHEISHSYFNNNLHGGTHSSLGIMVGVNSTSYIYSPYERSRPVLDWNINPTDVSTTTTHTLSDYVATGQMLRIQVPGSSSEYFWIANHQKVSLYDGISRGGKICQSINESGQNPYCGDGKGLFIYHEAPGCTGNFGKVIDLEQADGKWNWTVERLVPYWNPPPFFPIPLFEHISPNGGNPHTGYAEYLQDITANNGSGSPHVTDNPCSDRVDQFFVTQDIVGEGLDGFNMGYDEIFSPYSNPGSNSCVSPLSNAGLTIKLSGQDLAGNITLKVYFDNNLALSELPPSKPMNLKASKHIINPTTGRFNPKLNWDANTEPDFTGSIGIPGHYKIYRGYQSSCDPDQGPTQYSYVATVSAGTNEYIDHTVYMYPAGGGSGICTYLYRSYSYKIVAVDNTDLSSLESDRSIINGYLDPCAPEDNIPFTNNTTPDFYRLYNYPNPFNPTTEISYDLPRNSLVTLRIYNALGEETALLVNNEYRTAGSYSVVFDGSHLASGIYFYSIEAGTFKSTKKMVLIK
jgi:Secretion system C-terminal sorting domain